MRRGDWDYHVEEVNVLRGSDLACSEWWRPKWDDAQESTWWTGKTSCIMMAMAMSGDRKGWSKCANPCVLVLFVCLLAQRLWAVDRPAPAEKSLWQWRQGRELAVWRSVASLWCCCSCPRCLHSTCPELRLRTSRRLVRCCKLQCELCTVSISLLVQLLRTVSALAASVLAVCRSTLTFADQSKDEVDFLWTLWFSPVLNYPSFSAISDPVLKEQVRASLFFAIHFVI